MADKKVLGPYRTQVDGKRFVEEKQYRVGPSGLVRVEHALGKIRELPIFFGAGEPVLYTVTVVLRRVSAGDVKAQTSCTNMKVGDLVSPNSSETWQSHTAASIVELWPTVLAENWLEAPGTTAAILGHRARLNAIEEHLAMPRGGESFGAFKERAPQSRSAIGLWSVLSDGDVWCSTERKWRSPPPPWATNRERVDRDFTEDHAVAAKVDVSGGQIRRSIGCGEHVAVVRVVDHHLGLGAESLPHGEFCLLAVRGDALSSHPRRAHEIANRWPVVIGAEELTAAERVACGLPPESQDDLGGLAGAVEHG